MGLQARNALCAKSFMSHAETTQDLQQQWQDAASTISSLLEELNERKVWHQRPAHTTKH